MEVYDKEKRNGEEHNDNESEDDDDDHEYNWEYENDEIRKCKEKNSHVTSERFLDALREALKLRGILFMDDFECCTSCGFDAIYEYEGYTHWGFAFYHMQDTAYASKKGVLDLKIGSFSDDISVQQICQIVYDECKKNNYDVHWDGTEYGYFIIHNLDNSFFLNMNDLITSMYIQENDDSFVDNIVNDAFPVSNPIEDKEKTTQKHTSDNDPSYGSTQVEKIENKMKEMLDRTTEKINFNFTTKLNDATAFLHDKLSEYKDNTIWHTIQLSRPELGPCKKIIKETYRHEEKKSSHKKEEHNEKFALAIKQKLSDSINMKLDTDTIYSIIILDSEDCRTSSHLENALIPFRNNIRIIIPNNSTAFSAIKTKHEGKENVIVLQNSVEELFTSQDIFKYKPILGVWLDLQYVFHNTLRAFELLMCSCLAFNPCGIICAVTWADGISKTKSANLAMRLNQYIQKLQQITKKKNMEYLSYPLQSDTIFHEEYKSSAHGMSMFFALGTIIRHEKDQNKKNE